MRDYIVDTPVVKRIVSEKEMEETYLKAKRLNRLDGNRGPISILHVANTMGISRRLAAHMIRLNIEKLDYIDETITCPTCGRTLDPVGVDCICDFI